MQFNYSDPITLDADILIACRGCLLRGIHSWLYTLLIPTEFQNKSFSVMVPISAAWPKGLMRVTEAGAGNLGRHI